MDIQSLYQRLEQKLHQYTPFKKYQIELRKRFQKFLDPPRILFIGEFSVGKSSVINGLLQQEVLPSSATPTTAFITYLRYGKERVEVIYQSGEQETFPLGQLSQITSEREAAQQMREKKIASVNVYLQHPLLKKMTLVDSPGLNSLHKEHTEQTTRMMEEVDFCFWVFAYGKVGTQSEIAGMKALNRAGIRPIALINKIDQADEDDLSEYYAYELEKMNAYTDCVTGVSAHEVMESKEDPELYELSNYPELYQKIDEQLARTESIRQKRKDELVQTIYQLLEELDRMQEQSEYATDVLNFTKTVPKLLTEYQEMIEVGKALSHNDSSSKHYFQHIQQFIDFVTGDKHFEEWMNSEYASILEEHVPIQKWRQLLASYAHYQEKIQNEEDMSTEQWIELKEAIKKINFALVDVEQEVLDYTSTIDSLYRQHYLQLLQKTEEEYHQWMERQKQAITNEIVQLERWAFLSEIQEATVHLCFALYIPLPSYREFPCVALKKDAYQSMAQKEADRKASEWSLQPIRLLYNPNVIYPKMLGKSLVTWVSTLIRKNIEIIKK